MSADVSSAVPPATPPSACEPKGKRGRTRRAIADAAFALFAQRGFDDVRMTEIAAAADVAPATVFNHFASKEDIFFHRGDEFETELPAAVDGAEDATDLVTRLRGFYTVNGDILLGPQWLELSRVFARILLDSDALRRRYLPLQHERKREITRRALEKWPDADPLDMRLLAALTVAAGTTAFEGLHAGLAAGRPAQELRAEFRRDVDRGFTRVAAAFADVE